MANWFSLVTIGWYTLLTGTWFNKSAIAWYERLMATFWDSTLFNWDDLVCNWDGVGTSEKWYSKPASSWFTKN